MAKPDQIFSFLLDYTTRNMRRYAAETFAAEGLGITVDQWGVLLLLTESDAALSNTQLAERMVKDKPTMTRMVDVLVRKSLVVRRADKQDRRQQQISLTAKGKAAARKAEPIVERIRKEVGSALTKAQRESLIECLERLNARIEVLREPN